MNPLAYRTTIALATIAFVCVLGTRAQAENNQPTIRTLDPDNLVDLIDNPYFPLIPGTTFVYYAGTEDGHGVDNVAVTESTTVIMGVTCTAAQDTESVNGEVKEDTTEWYAQDTDDNVSYFGEYSTQYENGQVVGS